MRKYKLLTWLVLCTFSTFKTYSQQKSLAAWKEGYLDIHQIATGRGNSAFAQLPDGTTMLIDAGDLGNRVGLNSIIMPPLPDDSRLPAEWLSRYIKHFTSQSPNKNIDFALLTHFHNDHMGGASEKALQIPGRPYLLSGITQLAEYLPIHQIVDRGYPDYNYPSKEAVAKSTTDFGNYLRFIAFQQEKGITHFARFIPGSAKQFKLLFAPEKFPTFHIRNLYSNGILWTGKGEETRNLFPDIATLAPADYPNENILSNAVKISYGAFSYYSGGDVTGIIGADKPSWRDVESQLAPVVGQVDVALLNHHGYTDAMNSKFVKMLHPNSFVIPVWDFYHPQPETLGRLVDPAVYPIPPDIYATGLVPANKERLAEDAKYIKTPGHVVIRVYPGGSTYQIFVLNSQSEQYEVIYTSKIYQSKTK